MKHHGPSEAELEFELAECSSRGWEPLGADCIAFPRGRWASPDDTVSYYLSWLREEFGTVGQNYQIAGVERIADDAAPYDLVTVQIGTRNLILIRNSDPAFTGLRVDVSEVDGRSVNWYKE